VLVLVLPYTGRRAGSASGCVRAGWCRGWASVIGTKTLWPWLSSLGGRQSREQYGIGRESRNKNNMGVEYMIECCSGVARVSPACRLCVYLRLRPCPACIEAAPPSKPKPSSFSRLSPAVPHLLRAAHTTSPVCHGAYPPLPRACPCKSHYRADEGHRHGRKISSAHFSHPTAEHEVTRQIVCAAATAQPS
jgi:hypothetical protein